MRGALALVLLALLGCAAPRQPASLARALEIKRAPASQAAKEWAPQAYSAALLVEQEAQQAWEAQDLQAVQVLSQVAQAAHQHAWVLTRLAKAERRSLDAEHALRQTQESLALLRAQHQSLSSQAAALELRARVARSALPVPELERTAPKRRMARMQAARSLATEARLLCLAAQALGGSSEELTSQLNGLDELESQLAQVQRSSLLEDALALRASCLASLSRVRSQSSSELPAPDKLLSELSEAGLEPSRDERGVAVLLRSFDDGTELSEAARQRLAKSAEIALSNGASAALLVGHVGSSSQLQMVDSRLASAESLLRDSGLKVVATHNAGIRQPLAIRGQPGSKDRNTRLELVLPAGTL